MIRFLEGLGYKTKFALLACLFLASGLVDYILIGVGL